MPPRSHELYHWDWIREATIETTISESEIAGERLLEGSFGGARMLFGLGPPLAADPTEIRSLRLLNALAPAIHGLRWGRQVHGREIASITGDPDRGFGGAACVGECDALVTTEPGVGLMVWTADCVPILLEGPGVVAAIHSGWRGTAADIVGAVVHTFAVDYGVAADQIHAVLGPAISGPQYEVGTGVINALEAVGSDDDAWRRDNRVDLRLFLAGRLRRLGVKPGSIGVIGPCTASTAQLASYRRDGVDAGRQWSLVYRGCSGD
jgi:YfiH family protein